MWRREDCAVAIGVSRVLRVQLSIVLRSARPHTPWVVPQEFFSTDLFPPVAEIPLPPMSLRYAPVDMPALAWHPPNNVAGLSETPVFNGTLTNLTRAREYRRACEWAATILHCELSV